MKEGIGRFRLPSVVPQEVVELLAWVNEQDRAKGRSPRYDFLEELSGTKQFIVRVQGVVTSCQN